MTRHDQYRTTRVLDHCRGDAAKQRRLTRESPRAPSTINSASSSLRGRSTAAPSLSQGVLARRTRPGGPVPRPPSLWRRRGPRDLVEPDSVRREPRQRSRDDRRRVGRLPYRDRLHTDSTTASRIPSISPALAMAFAASSEPSKQIRTGRSSIGVLPLRRAPRSRSLVPHSSDSGHGMRICHAWFRVSPPIVGSFTERAVDRTEGWADLDVAG